MKLMRLLIVCLLSIASRAGGVVVTTEEELRAAVAARQTPIVLDADEFTLTSHWPAPGDLTIDYNCLLYPQGGRDLVIVNCNSWRLQLADSIITVGRPEPALAGRLRFINGGEFGYPRFDNVLVTSNNAYALVTFWHCDFDNCAYGSGLMTRTGGYPMTAICNDCNASGNQRSGFRMGNITPYPLCSLILNDCASTSNGFGGSMERMGVECSGDNTTLIINGGSYTDNGGTGIHVPYGCQAFLDGAVAINNATLLADSADISVSGFVDYVDTVSGTLVGAEWDGEINMTSGRVLDDLWLQDGAGAVAVGFGFGYDGQNLTGFWDDWTRMDLPLHDAETYAQIEQRLPLPPRPGDWDGDQDVDNIDMAAFAPCVKGPDRQSTGCEWAAFDADDDIDLADWAGFQRAFTWQLPE